MLSGSHCRYTRRDWLHLGGLGVFGLSLPGLLRGATSSRKEPVARSCVLFLLHGGPSQLDTWDMKPDAPDNIRGEFKPINTNVPGIRICEHLPCLAQRAHLYTIVRSMTHTAINHNTATYTVTTGHPPLRDLIAFVPTENDFPHLGAQVALGRPAKCTVPAAVSLPDPVTDGPYTTPGQNGGFLGAGYAPFRVLGDPNDAEFRVDGLAERPERLTDRESLRKQLDGVRSGSESPPAADGFDRYRERAVALLTSDETRRAFDLDGEPAPVRERYGRHKYGQSLLLARRLVEAGVRLVTVYWGGKVNNPNPHWDTHFDNNRRLKEELLPPFDECFSAFLDDLHARGLLATTLCWRWASSAARRASGSSPATASTRRAATTGRRATRSWSRAARPAAACWGSRTASPPTRPTTPTRRRTSRRRCCTPWVWTRRVWCATPSAETCR